MATPLRIDEGRKRLAREQVEQLAKQTGHLIAVAQKVYDAEYDKLRDDAKNRRASAANATYELFSA